MSEVRRQEIEESGVQLRLLPEPPAPVYPEPASQTERLAHALALYVLTYVTTGGPFRSPVGVTVARDRRYVILSSPEGASRVLARDWKAATVRWMKVEIARAAREPVEWFRV